MGRNESVKGSSCLLPLFLTAPKTSWVPSKNFFPALLLNRHPDDRNLGTFCSFSLSLSLSLSLSFLLASYNRSRSSCDSWIRMSAWESCFDCGWWWWFLSRTPVLVLGSAALCPILEFFPILSPILSLPFLPFFSWSSPSSWWGSFFTVLRFYDDSIHSLWYEEETRKEK